MEFNNAISWFEIPAIDLPRVQRVLDRIEKAGGTIVMPKTQISPEYGDMAAFIDTEGNRVAIYNIPH
jgi:uncharacterized protein